MSTTYYGLLCLSMWQACWHFLLSGHPTLVLFLHPLHLNRYAVDALHCNIMCPLNLSTEGHANTITNLIITSWVCQWPWMYFYLVAKVWDTNVSLLACISQQEHVSIFPFTFPIEMVNTCSRKLLLHSNIM